MAFLAGNNAKVAIGTATVVGMGNWSLDGITVDLLETTSFGDSAKQYITGLLDYGTVSFAGLYDPADTTGQGVLISALENNSAINSIRLYVDNTSYWTPDVTTNSSSAIYVTSANISMDKSGLGQVSFQARCTGPWVLE